MNILGISAYYHDSAAALIIDGKIIAAAQEERFTRKKHDPNFPHAAIRYCLDEAFLNLQDIDNIIFYEKPFIKFERLLETYLSYAPRGFGSFVKSMPIWLREKLYIKSVIKKELVNFTGCKRSELPPLLFADHHQSHAASAFFPSPFDNAAVLCLDAVGEWATASVWRGQGNQLVPEWNINFPHSLGLLYSAFTYYAGFKVNSGEYKLMGLAPYGEPVYVQTILDHLIDIKEDGTFRLNMEYFNYATGLTMTNSKFNKLFGGSPRKSESSITKREMDLAASIQYVTEEIVLRIGKTIFNELKEPYLCLAGGVALNCVANGRLLREGLFQDIWIQPAAGDAGGAIGAALSVWYEYYNQSRIPAKPDAMFGSYLGPRYQASDIRAHLDSIGAIYQELQEDILIQNVAKLLAEGNVIGWFQGRMEFGPRALGNRSILGDPRNPTMQSVMNLKIKYRESFRPFAPSVLGEKVNDYFELNSSSPYMLLVAPIQESIRIKSDKSEEKLLGFEMLKQSRSKIPAVTHVDYSARIQTVHVDTNPRYHKLISEFEKNTGCGVLINTSFNVRGEPIVCSPEDAYRCFMRTEIDYLVLESFLLSKFDQPQILTSEKSWKQEFELD